MPISLKSASGGNAYTGGALKLNGLQNGWNLSANAAQVGGTTVTSNITTTLTSVFSVDVPVGKQLVVCLVQATSGLSTSQLLTVELEIDGVTVLSGTVTPSTTALTFVGNNNVLTTSDLDRLLVLSNFKLKIRTATTTQTSIPFNFKYFLV